jgi:hypothetical protein
MDYCYIAFKWNDMVYFDTSLAFGLRSAAQACQRCTNALKHMVAGRGYSIVNYVDDLAGVECSRDRAISAAHTLDEIIEQSGLNIATNKSIDATQVMVFLGILFDGENMTMSVTADRMLEISKELELWSHRRRATKKQIQSLAGKLNFIAKCCKPGRVFKARILGALKGLNRSNHHVYLNDGFRQDIHWWIKFLPHFNSVSTIKSAIPKEEFATDACLVAGAGVCEQDYFIFSFPAALLDIAHSITQREMVTVVIAVKLWCCKWQGRRLLVICDNKATVQIINSGRAHESFLQACTRELVFLQCKFEF